MNWAEVYLRTKWRLHQSSRLATLIDISRKLGAVSLLGRAIRPHLTQRPWAEVYLRTKWRLDPSSRLATIDVGQKLDGGGGLSFFWEAGSPSNTKSIAWAEVYTSVPSGILVYPAV